MKSWLYVIWTEQVLCLIKQPSGNPNLKEKLNCVASSVDLLLSVFTWQGSIRLCLRVSSEETVGEWLMPWICSWLPFLKAENHQEEALKMEIGYLCSIMKLYCARDCMTLVILVPFLASNLVLGYSVAHFVMHSLNHLYVNVMRRIWISTATVA